MNRNGRYTNNQIPPQCSPFPLGRGSTATKERFILCESFGGDRVTARDLVRGKLWNASRRRHDSDNCNSSQSMMREGMVGRDRRRSTEVGSMVDCTTSIVIVILAIDDVFLPLSLVEFSVSVSGRAAAARLPGYSLADIVSCQKTHICKLD